MQTYTRILDVASVYLHSQLDLISDALAWNAKHQRADTYPQLEKVVNRTAQGVTLCTFLLP